MLATVAHEVEHLLFIIITHFALLRFCFGRDGGFKTGAKRAMVDELFSHIRETVC